MKIKNYLALFLALFLFQSCEHDTLCHFEDVYCVNEGSHAYRPVILTAPNDVMKYRWVLDGNEYDLGDSDQCDWNKLTGVSYDMLTNHKLSLMAAWRWDTAGYYWVAPYFHLNEVAYWANAPCTGYSISDDIVNGLTPIKVMPGEVFTTEIEIHENHGLAYIYIENQHGEGSSFVLHTGNQKARREIAPWFGGNEKATDHFCIKRITLH